jgi:hypothetical protein
MATLHHCGVLHVLLLLQWKRKAEQYLIASGLNYTIIHPGGEGQ